MAPQSAGAAPVAPAEMRRRSACRGRSTINHVQCKGAKSFADDLVTGQGVVLSRAASTLRSVETQPSVGRFVFHSATMSHRSVGDHSGLRLLD